MDPIAHTFTGAALAAAGLRRATPLATAALILAANAPDVDIVASFMGGYEQLAFRRGWTHGVLALPIWPFVLTGVLLLWDRWVRRRRNPLAAPARAGPLLAVAALAVLTHPTLDWLNNYGLRWLMPFDGTWFYGDALFVIDPWVWLVLGGALFVRYSNRWASQVRWAVFFGLASLLVLFGAASITDAAGRVPLPGRVLWVVALAALLAIRWRRDALFRNEAALDRSAATALAVVAVYMVAMVGASAAARSQVRNALAAAGVTGVEQVMVGPTPANPFAGDVVAQTADAYLTGNWNWLRSPRFALGGESFPRPRGAAFEAAARTHDARQFLTWARFPIAEVEPQPGGGFVVGFSDARYRTTGRLFGPSVRLNRDLQPE